MTGAVTLVMVVVVVFFVMVVITIYYEQVCRGPRRDLLGRVLPILNLLLVAFCIVSVYGVAHLLGYTTS